MSTIRKLNNNVNIVGTNVKKYRELQNLSQENLCREMQLLGVTMYIADIYEIENNKRLVKDFEAKAFSLVFKISLDDLYENTNKFFYQK
ncbi:MAG: helix-turn-helix transcriptional regulator [Clostridia bacterium]|jgi:transcriptional regulator with XRE-family HTH domain|nr:helix-turn-helix transcriptional regulator [Clostridia bacterium]MCI9413537.1 helix-turn-helix transcriptional regulator [Clostridia bacterium]